jgi:hypothetical protein
MREVILQKNVAMPQLGFKRKPWPAVVTKVPWFGDPTGLFSNPASAEWAHAQLGQTTDLAQPHNTVTLGEPLLPKVLTWGLILGLVGIIVKDVTRRTLPRGPGPDAIDELVQERARIQQRASRRKQLRSR